MMSALVHAFYVKVRNVGLLRPSDSCVGSGAIIWSACVHPVVSAACLLCRSAYLRSSLDWYLRCCEFR
jgi:hypothetical protein